MEDLVCHQTWKLPPPGVPLSRSSPNISSINLLNPRQRQANLIPIGDARIFVQRVPLQIYGLQVLLILELCLNLGKRGEVVAACPELLQLGDVLETG